MDERNDLIEQFTRIEWLLHRYHQKNHMCYGPMGDTRKGQGRLLAILKMQPEISQKDLSYLLDMRPQSMGELLSKLEKNGYITRTPSETDRRVMNIKLTKEGSEATNTAGQKFSVDKIFECLSEEEQKNLSSYLSRIIETIEAQLGDDQSGYDFDPRERGDNSFVGNFGGPCRDFGHHNGTGGGFHGHGQFDPRMAMNRHFGGMPFGHHHGMGQKQEGRPAPSLDKDDEK